MGACRAAASLLPGGSSVGSDMRRACACAPLPCRKVVEMHKVNVTRYGEEAVLNLLLLAHSRAFVGTFSSNFGRLAFELAYARRQGDVFGASMDVFWHAYP